MKTFVAVALVLCLAGCDTTTKGRVPVPVRAPMPELEDVQLPKLEEMTPEEVEAFRKIPESLQEKLIENDFRLKLSLKQSRSVIAIYNQFARENNALNAKTLGLPYGITEEPKK